MHVRALLPLTFTSLSLSTHATTAAVNVHRVSCLALRAFIRIVFSVVPATPHVGVRSITALTAPPMFASQTTLARCLTYLFAALLIIFLAQVPCLLARVRLT